MGRPTGRDPHILVEFMFMPFLVNIRCYIDSTILKWSYNVNCVINNKDERMKKGN